MKKLVLTAMVLGFVGCGHKEDSNSDSASVNPLAGTKWKTECLDSSIAQMLFEGLNNELVNTSYYDDTCDSPSVKISVKRAYSVSGQDIDYSTVSVSMTMLSESQVDGCNDSKCYGLDGWVLNVAKDVTGRSQDEASLPKAGDKLYQIFKIDGGVLHFGDTTKGGQEGDSGANRPKDFEPTNFNKF
jgi:hypothetical protein